MSARVPRPLVLELRAKLRDYPEINYLYEGKESEDQQLARVLWEAMEKVNVTPPLFSEEWRFDGSFPRPIVRLVIDLAVALTLQEVILWMMRNDFQYQAGNTTIRLFDRWRAYQTMQGPMEQKAMSAVLNYKVAYNSNRAWGQSLTEMFDGWRELDDQDWVMVSV